MSRWARFCLALAAALFIAPTVLLPAPVASGAPASDCSGTAGVLVVVDLRPWDQGIQRGCDPSPTTGYTALNVAGFASAGTQHDGPAFVCRIGVAPRGTQYPTPEQDPCVRTPPASAYWSYWHAEAGQTSWSYSTLGAMSYKPNAGSVDAWVFGATDTAGTFGGPSFSPQDVGGAAPAASAPVEPTPAEPSAEPPAPTAGSQAPGATTAAPPPATVDQTTEAPATEESTSNAPTTSGSTTSSRASASPSGSLTVVDVQRAYDEPRSGGSIVPVILGVALAAALAGAGGFVAWRRRQQTE